MSKWNRWFQALAVCAGIFIVCDSVSAQKALSLPAAEGRAVEVPVLLSTDEAVEGFTLSVSFDPVLLVCTDVRPAGAAQGAELFDSQILPGGFTVYAILDAPPPSGGPVIPPGEDQPIAVASLRTVSVAPPQLDRDVELRFEDGLGNPPRSNSVAAGGRTITVGEGLQLHNGTLHIPAATDKIAIEKTRGGPGEFTVRVPVRVDTQRPLQGYAVCVRHPLTIELVGISTEGTDAEAAGIEFQESSIEAGKGALSVLFDAEPPFDGQELPPGEGLTVAFFTYRHRPFTSSDPWQPACRTYDLFLPDIAAGDCGNFFIQKGTRHFPALEDGTVTFCSAAENLPTFYVGAQTAERIPRLTCAVGTFMEKIEVSFFYTSPVPIQGVSLGLCYPPEIHILDLNNNNRGVITGRHLAGTITEAVRAEYVSFHADDEKGELVVGILVDSTPPVPLTHMLPPRDRIGKLLNVFFIADDKAPCSTCLELKFCEGIKGAGTIPIFNRASIFDESRPVMVEDGCLCLDPQVHFYAGIDSGGDRPEIKPAIGTAGGRAAVNLYYTSQVVPLQGISMALSFPPELAVTDLDANGQGMLKPEHLGGTLTENLQAEFVSFNADNDRGELIVGILVDATPPVPINHMFPPTEVPACVFRVFFAVPSDARCGTLYPIKFREGLTGAGNVPVFNRVSVFNKSCPAVTHDGVLRIVGSAPFLRGDCNTDWQVDIADPAATMSFLFLNNFHPECLDACDSNDDGVVDLADVSNTLRFLVQLGPEPPPPGPFPPGGFDPTPDRYGLDLGCERGQVCRQ